MFATLCYVQNHGQVLLQRKAAGLFGEGRWNAPGGKLLEGEAPESGAQREVLEETGSSVNGLRFHGLLNFYLGSTRRLDQAVFVFSCCEFKGVLQPNREGELRWFSLDEMPYDRMWEDDRFWVPLLLDGKSFVGDFHFSAAYQRLIQYRLELVNNSIAH